ncbi:MAG: hypothetical protein KGI41_04245, partial [Patescibacteria group bacterium]|nr:hypothetical protein [Patescibacteria group bacterium]
YQLQNGSEIVRTLPEARLDGFGLYPKDSLVPHFGAAYWGHPQVFCPPCDFAGYCPGERERDWSLF